MSTHMWQALRRQLTEAAHLGTRSFLWTYNNNKHLMCLVKISMGEGDSHCNDAGNDTPASDVI